MHWAYVIRITVYILNRSLTSTLDGITPYEEWYEKKPNVNNFRVFGCLAYAHVLDKNRRKLDPKTKACIFVGWY